MYKSILVPLDGSKRAEAILPHVEELFVQPAASDAGTAVGAASYVAHDRGDRIEKQEHVYLGPAFTTEECRQACEAYPQRPVFELVDDAPREAARLLAEGHPVAWYQGRMEFGPRALGNRSILGDPSRPGMADRINAQIAVTNGNSGTGGGPSARVSSIGPPRRSSRPVIRPPT